MSGNFAADPAVAELLREFLIDNRSVVIKGFDQAQTIVGFAPSPPTMMQATAEDGA